MCWKVNNHFLRRPKVLNSHIHALPNTGPNCEVQGPAQGLLDLRLLLVRIQNNTLDDKTLLKSETIPDSHQLCSYFPPRRLNIREMKEKLSREVMEAVYTGCIENSFSILVRGNGVQPFLEQFSRWWRHVHGREPAALIQTLNTLKIWWRTDSTLQKQRREPLWWSCIAFAFISPLILHIQSSLTTAKKPEEKPQSENQGQSVWKSKW